MIADRLEALQSEISSTISSYIISAEVDRNHLTIDVPVETLSRVASSIYERYSATLVSMHAADYMKTDGMFRLYVVLSIGKEDTFITLRAGVKESDGSFPSLTPEIYPACWYEREMADMFGLTPVGHPELRPLVLYDDWPSGHYPLRKDFDLSTKVSRVKTEYPFRKVDGEGIFEIPVGPVHAGVIEPGHFRFSVAGEPIINLEVRMGYVHKGTEKLFESMTYDRGVYLAERISGDNTMAHSTAYCQAVENAARTTIPERAAYIRTVFMELERIYNHFGDVGGISLDTAYNVGAQHAYILREKILQLNECITGSRLLRSVNCIGGVRRDISDEDSVKIRETLVKVTLDFNDFVELVTKIPSFLDRAETTGILSEEAARGLNIMGPGARASGVRRDVRKDHPYAAYKDLSFRVPMHKEGDVYARMRVKIEEVYESMSIIEQALNRIPQGPVKADVPAIPEGLTGMGLVESPRGEAVHWMISGNDRPYRHKVRDPSFHNWQAMEVAVLGNIVPDFPLINKSFNLSYSGNDL